MMTTAKFHDFDEKEIEVRRLGKSRNPVLVIDNVLQNPEEIRELALSLQYSPGSKSFYYPGYYARCALAGISSTIKWLAKYVWEEVYDLGDIPYADYHGVAGSSHFSCFAPDMHSEYNVVHSDGDRWLAVLIHLSDTENSGTAFWRDQESGLESYVGNDILAIQKADAFFNIKNSEQWRSFVMRPELSATDISHDLFNNRKLTPPFPAKDHCGWELLDIVDCKFNRLLVYPGWTLHSIAYEDYMPGFTLAQSRLTLNAFVDHPIPALWSHLKTAPPDGIIL